MINTKLEAKDLIEDYKKKALKFPHATNSAINKVAVQTKTFISKEIRSEYNIKAALLNKNFHIEKSTWKTLRAKIEGTGAGIGLKQFGAKRTSRAIKQKSGKKRFQVQVKIKKGKPIERISGNIFMGKKIVWERTETHPFERVYGPGVAAMFNRKMQNKASIFIQNKFPAILENEIKFFNE